jgi:Carboxypeptidase regulatory-like domain/TonB-dependent Receptor Plug Domain
VKSVFQASMKLLLIAVITLAPSMFAQSIVTGGIAGTVTDQSGAVVANVTLTLKNSDTGEVSTATSSASGTYVFALLKPGEYTLSAAKEGFRTSARRVTVTLGTTTGVKVALDIGSSSTTVEVVGGPAVQLQTEDANISSSFDNKQIQEVPNPGGDVTYVAQTAPGVTMANPAGGGYGNFSTFGLPGTSNLFTMNGNDYNDPFLNLNNSGSSNLLLGGNELQEVSVVNNGYTGQYGRQAGSQIDYTTKSGSNAWHGNAVYDWTGRYLNANDPLLNAASQPRPFENNNQWAASFGGPVIKDKLFFFVNTEGIRYIFGTAHPVTTPTAAFENYVLGNLPTLGLGVELAPTTSFYQNAFSLWNAAPGISNAKPNSGSCTAAGLPATIGADQCTQTWTDSSSSGNKEWLLSGRVDYSLGDRDKIFGRVKIDRGVQPTYTDTINPAFDTFSTQPQDDGQLNYTHIFTPNVVNSFIGNVLYYSALFGQVNANSPALGLIPGDLALSDGSLTNLGFGSGEGGFQDGFFFPMGRNVTQWGVVDDLSVTTGNHAFKMGANLRRDDVSDHTASALSVYPGVQTTLMGLANDQVATGTAFNFTQTPVQPVATYSLGLYFQDEFRESSKLKLTLTLRADRNSGGVCQHNCAGLPVTPFNDLPHGANAPYDQSFQTGLKTIIPGNELIVFQPRFGFAYTPWGDKTVLRGGVGLFADLYPGAVLSGIDTNFPQVNVWNVPGGNLAWDLKPSASSAFPTSGVAIVQGCNSAFTQNYNTGGNLTSYESAAPNCTNTGSPADTVVNGVQSFQLVPALNDVSRNLQNPKYVEWNVEVQRMITTHTILSMNYVGNRGFAELYNNPYLNGFGQANLPTSVPDPRVGRVNFLSSGAVSNYNGLTLSIQEQAWHGLSGRFNYSYSHALDESSNGGVLPFSVFYSLQNQIDPFSLRKNYASADYDARHQLSGSYVYALPFKPGNRMLNAAVGGWQLSGTLFFRTGFPFSVFDSAYTNNLTANNLTGATFLMQPLFSQRKFGDVRACIAAPCFGVQGEVNSSAPYLFAATTSTTPFAAAVGRNAFRGPGFLGGDMSIRKNVRITERVVFQLGLNAYNWFNHANYGTPYPATNFGTDFGQTIFTEAPPTSPYGAFASAATDMRMAQIEGKITF